MAAFDQPQYYLNRELSWLEFNQRVLDETQDLTNPLMERVKFLSITLSNLDEFFMVRVAGVMDLVHEKKNTKDPAGLTPLQQKEKIAFRVHQMMDMVYERYHALNKELEKTGFELVQGKEITQEDHSFLQKTYEEEIYPVLTPMAVDPSRPFPLLLNKTLNLALLLENPEGEEARFATVQIPSVLPRIYALSSGGFILLEEIIALFLETLFPNQKILTHAVYRITRSGDLNFQEEEAQDLLKEMEQSLLERRRGAAVRLEIDRKADEKLVAYLQEKLDLQEEDLYFCDGPVDVSFLSKAGKMLDLSAYEKESIVPQTPQDLLGEEDLFEAIRKKDILMHHPYESFQPVVHFLQLAAEDPSVLAIKQTLYRVSGNSPIVQALSAAAQNGKQVTVLVEVKARFDEENNIHWAKKLEKAGCHVIYGLVGLKTHCKVTIVVRRDPDRIRRYVHLGTGNYNDVTARLYTDLGLFTCKEAFGADASALFNELTGYGDPPYFRKLTAAPLGLRSKFIHLIRREAEHARAGHRGRIIAKMNSLLDQELIAELYAASAAGVRIDLIVRGICALKPGIPGVSENIRVRSIVGWLLEHSRIYYFYNDGYEEYYLSSADWMSRNLDHRVELLFPIEDPQLQKRLEMLLDGFLQDNQKARLEEPDGRYVHASARFASKVNIQESFYNEAIEHTKAYEAGQSSPLFVPMSSEDLASLQEGETHESGN